MNATELWFYPNKPPQALWTRTASTYLRFNLEGHFFLDRRPGLKYFKQCAIDKFIFSTNADFLSQHQKTAAASRVFHEDTLCDDMSVQTLAMQAKCSQIA